MTHALLRLTASLTVSTLALSLSSCISLLPKEPPAQLYRFGVATAHTPERPPERPGAVGLLHSMGQFQREAAGDRILTVTGAQAAYIADARWVAPAEVLFEEAVANAFDSAPGRVRLVARGESAPKKYSLRLDVRTFETEYGAGGVPSVLLRVRAVLSRETPRTPVSEQIFEARAPAAENRVSAIVAAYDQALNQVLGQIVAWTNSAVS